MPPPVARVWVAAGSALSGAATYALFIVAARALRPELYGAFSFFWAATVIASIGLFLPMEQLLARRLARAGDSAATRRATFAQGLRASAGVGAVSVVVILVVWALVRGTEMRELLLAAILAVGIAGCALQFPSRGVLAAMDDFRGYAVVVCVDAGVRLAIALGLWVAAIESPHAFAVAVSTSAVICGLVGRRLALDRLTAASPAVPVSSGEAVPPAPTRYVGREAARLVTAATCMQLLLNSGILVASVADGAQEVFAGHLVATLTLARLPVFVAQSLQASYVSKVAGHAHRGEVAELRRLLGLLVGVVVVAGGATLSVAAALGAEIVAIVNGPSYVVSREMAALAALGVVSYLAAAVANDVAVAVGASRRVLLAWVAGAVVGVVAALGADGLLLRATLPLLVGPAVAASILWGAVARGVRTNPRA